MRERFHAVSDRISAQLAQLAWQIDRAPAPLRASVSAAAQEVAAAQGRMRAQMERLPADPEQRYHIMRSLLQAQFAAFEHLGAIVGQLAAQPWPTPMPYPAPGMLPTGYPGPGSAPPDGQPMAHGPPGTPPGPPGDSELAIAARLEHLLQGERAAAMAYAPAQHGWYGGNAPGGSVAAVFSHSDADGMDDDYTPKAKRGGRRGRSTMPAIYSRRLAVMAVVAGGLMFAYVAFPRPEETRNIGVRSGGEQKSGRVAIGDPAAVAAGQQPAGFDRQASPFPPFAAVPAPPTMTQPPLAERARPPSSHRVISAPVEEPQGAREDASPPVALPPVTNSPQPADSRLRRREAAVQSEAGPPVQTDQPPAPRFVPVVVTHRDRNTALEAFADLQKQFPAVVGSRKGEVQPVDLGDKGVWHRLVVLPAGSRQRADALCEQLKTAGYDRCWVKAY
jgi:hypothetical protein